MELVEKLAIWILLTYFNVNQVQSGRVLLNGPSIQTSDLRAIDGYVASGLPLFANTHGFVLHSGMRPVIVKVKDPNKVIRDGIEQPNSAYYRDLPAVIPHGFEGVSSTSFLLGNPIPPSRFFAPKAGPVVSFSPPVMKMMSKVSEPMMTSENTESQTPQPIAEQSIRVENTLNPMIRAGHGVNQIQRNNFKPMTNPVVVQTSEFESNLPNDFRNPFYRNEMLASTLARESLPAPGEELVDEWNTNKIREGRVRDLLSGAGLI